jgi:hypothetical protein
LRYIAITVIRYYAGDLRIDSVNKRSRIVTEYRVFIAICVSLKCSPTAVTVIQTVNISKKMIDGYLEAICPTQNSINIGVLDTKMRENSSRFII